MSQHLSSINVGFYIFNKYLVLIKHVKILSFSIYSVTFIKLSSLYHYLHPGAERCGQVEQTVQAMLGPQKCN